MRRRRRPHRTRTILTLSLALFFVLFYPFYLIQWFGYLLIALVLLSYGYSRSMTTHLSVRRVRKQIMTYRGQTAFVELVVENRGYLRIPYLSVIDTTGGLYTANDERRILTLRAGEQVRVRYPVMGVNRGMYRLGPLRVRVSDPLGLYPRQFEIREIATVVIYPQVYRVRIPDYRGLPAGTVRIANPIYEDVTRYRGVREYVFGDDPRRISWKVSARFGRLHTLESLPTIYFPTLIVLNLTADDYQRRHRFHHTERAIEAAASLVFDTVRKGQEVGFTTSGVVGGSDVCPSLPMRGGHDHGSLILGTLARLTANNSDCDVIVKLLTVGAIPYGTRIQYVGPRLREDQIEFLSIRIRPGTDIEFFYIQEQVQGARTTRLSSFREYSVREYGEPIIARTV